MVDWNSPTEIAHDSDAFAKFVHALLGLYVWEWVTSLNFEWSFISGKRTFRWPLIFYFLGRYCLLFAFVGLAITLNIQVQVNCHALYTFNQCLGNFAIGLACVNLSIRTIAVWASKLYIVIPLIAIILGHWAVLLHGILIKSEWVPGEGCVITGTDNALLSATFIYSMCLDFLTMALTGYKLAYKTGSHSRLVQMIFGDGLIYFFIAFCANLLATIFMTLNLNPVMSVIGNVPAATTSTIVACRVVRRLTNYTTSAAEMFTSTQNSYTRRTQPNVSVKPAASQGVHVQMNTFAMNASSEEYVVSQNKEFDPESQTIPDVKREPF